MNPSTYGTDSLSQKHSWLALARIGQLLIILLTISLFVVSIPINYEQRGTICDSEPCAPGQLNPAVVQALNDAGLTVEGLVQVTIALDILLAVAYTACAVFIMIRKPNDAVSIFVTIMLVTFGTATFSGAIRGLAAWRPEMELVSMTIEMIGSLSIVTFLFIFPSGRFTPRWTSLILTGWIIFQLPRYYFPNSPLHLQNSSPLLYNIIFIGGILSGLGSQIYRFRRVSRPIERQQTKWVVYGLIVGLGGYVVVRLFSSTLTDPLGSQITIALGFNIISILFMLLLPLTIGVAVLRFRLWDINPIINRTLVYGALSASTMAFYLLVVGLFSTYFRNSTANFIIAFIATGIVAIIFEPLRERLQRGVNRLMYGERDDPATLLVRLSQRLDTSLAADSILSTIVETVAQTLRLPYAAISLYLREANPGEVGDARVVAEFGTPAAEMIHLPLAYQGNRVGELLLAPRAVGESLSTADTRLLNIIAQQAGIAAHTVQLTDELRQLNVDLQQSRQRLVTAQEEERRRLRRDLHDGVGPTLASLSQRLDTAADLVTSRPQASVEMLKELKSQVRSVLAEIRRLVYNLRPPALDEFGLLSAIREHIAPYTGPNGLQVTLNAPEPMPPLSAAVEVAAYRIILEAFTNVVQHAQACSCQIDIKVEDEWLSLQVLDDGKGLSSATHLGVGFTSMRERAGELRGECHIENNSTGGLRVHARLPIPKD